MIERITDQEVSLAATGISGLDDILGGGLAQNRLYLIDGDPGAGKTTLALQFLLEGVNCGEQGLYVTLSETKHELAAVARSHGWTVDGFEVVEILGTDHELTGENQLTMYHSSEVELSETMRTILTVVERINPKRVVFDSLSELRLLAQNPLRYRRQILALKQFFLGRHSTVLLLDDRATREVDVQLQSIAHGVISLEQLAPLYGSERRRVRVIKYRGVHYRGGYHDFRIRRGGLEVFPRLIAGEHYTDFSQTPVSSGISHLDKLLGGGLDRGTSTLLMGPAGSGKSTVALQYAIAAAERGDHAVVFAFDESVKTMRKRLCALGIKFDEGFEAREVKVNQIDPAEVSPGEFAQQVRDAVDNDNAKVIVIDSLNGYLNAMPEERFLVVQLHELLSYLARKGVATLMVVAQHGLVDSSMETPVDTSYLADSVVLFRYFEDNGKIKKAVSVIKKRSGAHEDTIRELFFNQNGINVSEPLHKYRGVLRGAPIPTTGNSSVDKG